MFPRFFCLSVFLVLFLTSCANIGNQIPSDLVFNTSSEKALIIVGLQPSKTSLQGLLPQLNIRKFDLESMKAEGSILSFYVPTGISRLGGLAYEEEANRDFYVFLVEPGEYYFESLYGLFWSKRKEGRVSISKNDKATRLLQDETYYFTALPGKKIYIGDMIYELEKIQTEEYDRIALSSHFKKGTPNPSKADSILNKYSGIRGVLNYQEPKPIRFTCETQESLIEELYECPLSTVSLSDKAERESKK